MSKTRDRLIRKVLFGLAGTFFGGIVGRFVANELEVVHNITDEGILDILHAGLTSAGGLVGGETGRLIEKAISSESPPSNPKNGELWLKPSTKQIFVWINTDIGWLETKPA